MKNLTLVSACLSTSEGEATFKFNGYLNRQKITSIELKTDRCPDKIEAGKDYIVQLNMISIDDGILSGEVIKMRCLCTN